MKINHLNEILTVIIDAYEHTDYDIRVYPNTENSLEFLITIFEVDAEKYDENELDQMVNKVRSYTNNNEKFQKLIKHYNRKGCLSVICQLEQLYEDCKTFGCGFFIDIENYACLMHELQEEELV